MRCQLIRCLQCEQMNYATGDICAVCGATLPPATELEDFAPGHVRPKPRWLPVSLGLGSLLMLAGLGYMQQYKRSPPLTESASFTPNSAVGHSAKRDALHPVPSVPYKVTQTWATPAGGRGQCILIAPRYARPKWLRLLGQQLSREAATVNFTRVEVFDNPQAAAIRANRLYGGTKAEAALELKYHVAQYIKKDSPHLCALIAYFDGFGSVNQQTYRY